MTFSRVQTNAIHSVGTSGSTNDYICHSYYPLGIIIGNIIKIYCTEELPVPIIDDIMRFSYKSLIFCHEVIIRAFKLLINLF